jgi:hypothetical protein
MFAQNMELGGYAHLNGSSRFQVRNWKRLSPLAFIVHEVKQRVSCSNFGILPPSCKIQVSTCIGNWQEERELRRSILKDLLAKKTAGSLKLDA